MKLSKYRSLSAKCAIKINFSYLASSSMSGTTRLNTESGNTEWTIQAHFSFICFEFRITQRSARVWFWFLLFLFLSIVLHCWDLCVSLIQEVICLSRDSYRNSRTSLVRVLSFWFSSLGRDIVRIASVYAEFGRSLLSWLYVSWMKLWRWCWID